MTKIRLFAAAKQFIGSDSIDLDLQEPITVGRLRELLLEQHAALSSLLPFARFAVNSEYVDDDAMLQPNDEVAIIPPVSGG